MMSVLFLNFHFGLVEMERGVTTYHIHQKIKAYSMLGIVKRNFIHMDPRTFILLYKAFVRPHVKYANSVWSPYNKGHIEAIEKFKKSHQTCDFT